MDDTRAKFEKMTAGELFQELRTEQKNMTASDILLAKEVLREKNPKLTEQKSTSKPNTDQIPTKSEFREVIVKDIDMSFGNMVVFMVKWALASIPAMIILFIIGFVILTIFGISII